MAEFTEQNTIPKSGFYIPPKYATGASKFWLKLMGYDAGGQRNAWGKALMVVGPTNGVLSNIAAQKIAGNNNATATQDNINDALAGNVGMLKAQIGVGKAILGGYTGNAGLIADGAGDVMGGTTMAATSKKAQTGDDGAGYYRKYKDGNKVLNVMKMQNKLSPSTYIRGKVMPQNKKEIKLYADDESREDIEMLDKTTGKKVGEMRYGERIFDQKANKDIEQLTTNAKRTGNYSALGKYVAKEMATHDDQSSDRHDMDDKEFEDGGMMMNADGFQNGEEDYYDENGNFIPKRKKKTILESLNPIFDSLMSGISSFGMGGGKGGKSGGDMNSSSTNSLSNMNRVKRANSMRGGGKLLSPSVLVKSKNEHNIRKYAKGNKVIKPPTDEILFIMRKGYEGMNGSINPYKLEYGEKQKLKQWLDDNKENMSSGSFIRSVFRNYNDDGSARIVQPDKLTKAWNKFDNFLENNGKQKVSDITQPTKIPTVKSNPKNQNNSTNPNTYGANTFSGEVYNPSKSKNTGTPILNKSATTLSPSQLLKNSYKSSQTVNKGVVNTGAISGIRFMSDAYKNKYAALADTNNYQNYTDYVNGLSASDLKNIVKGTKYENYTPEKIKKLATDKMIGEVHAGFIELYNKIRGNDNDNNTITSSVSSNKTLTNQDKANFSKRTTPTTTTLTNEDKQNIFLSKTKSDTSLPSDESAIKSGKSAVSKVSDYLDYAMNGTKFLLGAMGAKKPLPTWQIPESWNQYVRDAEMQSKQGFTTLEKDVLHNNLERNRSASVEAIRQTIGGGGSSGAVLAALDGTNRNTALAENDLSLKDASMQRQNFAQYGNVLGKDVSLDRQLFEDEYTKAAQSKNASAQLMASGAQGIIDETQYNKSYGAGSAYDQLQKAIIAEKNLSNEALKQKMDGASNDIAFKENTQKAIDGLSEQQLGALSTDYKELLRKSGYTIK